VFAACRELERRAGRKLSWSNGSVNKQWSDRLELLENEICKQKPRELGHFQCDMEPSADVREDQLYVVIVLESQFQRELQQTWIAHL